MLEIKNLCYSVPSAEGDNEIINNISLTVPDGTLLVLTGPNGGGKSTLAKLIMGIEKPTSGRILWNGTDITDMGITERAKAGISFAFQQPVRFKGISVRRLLELAAGRKLSEEELYDVLRSRYRPVDLSCQYQLCIHAVFLV